MIHEFKLNCSDKSRVNHRGGYMDAKSYPSKAAFTFYSSGNSS